MWQTFVELTDEIRLSFHALSHLAETAHADRGVSTPMRAVLEYLRREGNSTVPQIARARGVSRQHVQVTVNQLCDKGLTDVLDNPAHQRSGLVHLTPAGRCVIDETLAAEERLCLEALEAFDETDLVAATETLRGVRMSVQDLTQEMESP